MSRSVSRSFLPLLALALFIGCGPQSSTGSGSVDFTVLPDLSLADGGPTGPDLAYAGPRFQFVIDRVNFPQTTSDFTYAINHDNYPHNQFAKLTTTLAQKNLPLLTAQTVALTIDGDALMLLSLGTTDPNLVSDPKAFVAVYVARQQRAPVLSGGGTFTINTGEARGRIDGQLMAGQFYAADPGNQASPPTAPLRIALLGTSRVTLPLVGAHMTFTPGANGLTNGVLHGALKQSDIDGVLVPALARNLTELAKATPCATECLAALAFDTSPTDGMISNSEVQSNLALVLKSDLDLYDASGKWAPNAANASPDSMSIGIGFTAKKATFTE